jgi:hypothetical protein
MTMRVAIAFAALLAVSCASTAAAPSPSPSPSATASVTSTPAAVPSPTPSPSPTGRVVPFPDLTYIVGTNTGDLFFQIKDGQPAGRKVHVCADAVRNLVAYGRRAAFVCGPAGDQTLYVYDDATGTTAAVAKTEVSWPGFAFTPTGGLVYVTMGAEVPSAPIAMTKLVLLDLKTRTTTTIDERFGVAFSVWLSSGGVAVWRPQNSLSFVRPEAEAGTWLLRDKTLVRLSLHRLVAGYEGRYLLEPEPRDSGGSTYLVLRTDRETRLTPSDVANEQGVEVLPDGRIFAWRPQNGPFEGTMVVYQDGAVIRQDRGRFSTFGLLHTADWTTHTTDWIIGQEISGPPSTTYRAYRLSDGAFASIPAGNITSLGFLGPNN